MRRRDDKGVGLRQQHRTDHLRMVEHKPTIGYDNMMDFVVRQEPTTATITRDVLASNRELEPPAAITKAFFSPAQADLRL